MPKLQITLFLFECPQCNSTFGGPAVMPLCCSHCGYNKHDFKSVGSTKITKYKLGVK